jgi:hypothetical protein
MADPTQKGQAGFQDGIGRDPAARFLPVLAT